MSINELIANARAKVLQQRLQPPGKPQRKEPCAQCAQMRPVLGSTPRKTPK